MLAAGRRSIPHGSFEGRPPHTKFTLPCVRENQCALPAVKAARLGRPRRDQRARPDRALPTPSRSPAAQCTQRSTAAPRRQGLRACARSGSARGARRRGNDRGSVGTTAGRRAAPIVLKTATSERPYEDGRGPRGLACGCTAVGGSSISSQAAATHLVTQEVAGSDRPLRCCRSRASR
jgi:hypothetical protein